MANRRQSIKKIRVDKRRRENNVRVISELKTVTRKVREAFVGKEKTVAQKAVRDLFSKIDKAVKKNTLHKNRASRIKSRIQLKLNKLVPVKSSK